MVLTFKILRCFKSSSCNEISRYDQPGRPGNNMSNYIVVTPWEETVEKEGLSGQGERQPPAAYLGGITPHSSSNLRNGELFRTLRVPGAIPGRCSGYSDPQERAVVVPWA